MGRISGWLLAMLFALISNDHVNGGKCKPFKMSQVKYGPKDLFKYTITFHGRKSLNTTFEATEKKNIFTNKELKQWNTDGKNLNGMQNKRGMHRAHRRSINTHAAVISAAVFKVKLDNIKQVCDQ